MMDCSFNSNNPYRRGISRNRHYGEDQGRQQSDNHIHRQGDVRGYWHDGDHKYRQSDDSPHDSRRVTRHITRYGDDFQLDSRDVPQYVPGYGGDFLIDRRASTVSFDMGSDAGGVYQSRAQTPPQTINVESFAPYTRVMPRTPAQRLMDTTSDLIEDEEDAAALFAEILSETQDFSVAKVLLLRRYNVELSALQSVLSQGSIFPWEIVHCFSLRDTEC